MRAARKQNPRMNWLKPVQNRAKPPVTANKRLAEQTRKILGKHYEQIPCEVIRKWSIASKAVQEFAPSYVPLIGSAVPPIPVIKLSQADRRSVP